MDEYIKAQVEMIRQALQDGGKITVEISNETMHLDPKTGAMISDSYTEESFTIPKSDLAI